MPESAQAEKADRDAANSRVAQSEASTEDKPAKPAVDWTDPTVPAGNAPPLPRWPLILSAVTFGLWLAFLVWMVVLRRTGTS